MSIQSRGEKTEKRGPFLRESSFPGSISLDRRPPFYPGEQITRNRVRRRVESRAGRRSSRTLNAHDGARQRFLLALPRGAQGGRPRLQEGRRRVRAARRPRLRRARRVRGGGEAEQKARVIQVRSAPRTGHDTRERTSRARVFVDTRVHAREPRSARAVSRRVAPNARARRAMYQNPRTRLFCFVFFFARIDDDDVWSLSLLNVSSPPIETATDRVFRPIKNAVPQRASEEQDAQV